MERGQRQRIRPALRRQRRQHELFLIRPAGDVEQRLVARGFLLGVELRGGEQPRRAADRQRVVRQVLAVLRRLRERRNGGGVGPRRQRAYRCVTDRRFGV